MMIQLWIRRELKWKPALPGFQKSEEEGFTFAQIES